MVAKAPQLRSPPDQVIHNHFIPQVKRQWCRNCHYVMTICRASPVHAVSPGPHCEPGQRLVDGGFSVAERLPDSDVGDQAGDPPVVKLADFDAEILCGLFLGQEAVFSDGYGRLRVHSGDGVSRPPRR